MLDVHPHMSVWRDPAEREATPAPIGRLALIGNFPPRRCGIATFTGDVHEALTEAYPGLACDVYAMNDEGGDYAYPSTVAFTLRQNAAADYLEAARRINQSGADAVCIQHEYGIFGGAAGEHLLILLNAVRAPVIATLHTILTHPDPDQRRVMERIVQRASRLVVMSRKGREILREVYGVPAAKIAVVPHGTPDYPMVEPEPFKPRFGLQGREVLFTFGLLSPGKGLETMIRAMPAIRQARPDAVYLILGATHPHLVAREGEAYREGLMALAGELGVADAVRFDNAYVDTPLLLQYLAAADIYVTPYPNEAQITSGTLSYAVGMGKPVISTPYWHAAELLADDRGVLTPFNDPAAMAAAAVSLLSDNQRRDRIRANAYAAGREMIWSRLAAGYMGLLSTVSSERRQHTSGAANPLPAANLAAIEAMTDSCGIAQHAVFGIPDRRHGYCVDDNARALLLLVRMMQGQAAQEPQLDRLANIYAAFVQHAWNPDNARFRNFMSFDRRWLEDAGSDDSFGRAFWAVCETASFGWREDLRVWARSLAERAMPAVGAFDSPRTLAFLILGLDALLASRPGDATLVERLSAAAGRLAHHMEAQAKPEWRWVEQTLSYDNARLPEALIRAGATLKDERLTALGLEALEWLCAVQTAPSGCFRPVGSAGFPAPAYSPPAQFDQQPLEAAATMDACAAAIDSGHAGPWLERARTAYGWFLGENDLGVSLVQADGGCYDGLTPTGPNLNRGAESLLSFQLATVRMASLAATDRVTSVGLRG